MPAPLNPARLSEETAAAVERGFAKRGGEAGKPLVLDGTFTEAELRE